MDHLKYEEEELKRTGTEIVRIPTIPFTYNYRKVASKVSLRGAEFPTWKLYANLGEIEKSLGLPPDVFHSHNYITVLYFGNFKTLTGTI